MRTRFFACLATFLVMLGALGCGSKSAYGTVDGFVRDSGGDPVYQAIVEAVNDGNSIKEATTDMTGHFRLENLPAGKAIDLSFTKDGFVTGQHSGILLSSRQFYALSTVLLKVNENTVVIKGVITLE